MKWCILLALILSLTIDRDEVIFKNDGVVVSGMTLTDGVLVLGNNLSVIIDANSVTFH